MKTAFRCLNSIHLTSVNVIGTYIFIMKSYTRYNRKQTKTKLPNNYRSVTVYRKHEEETSQNE